MDKPHTDHEMLELIDRPGFFVENGIITFANALARQHLIETGKPIADLLQTGSAEYQDLSDGTLFLQLNISGTNYEATVSRIGEQNLFLLDHRNGGTELQALALASQQLRYPIAQIIQAVDSLKQEFPQSNQLHRISHNLYRLIRIAGNMSDASGYQNNAPKKASCNVCAAFESVLEESKALLEAAGITLSYSLPDRNIYCMLSKEMLTRAVYNILSNAAKYTAKGSALTANVSRSGHLLYFTVSGITDSNSELPANFFYRYLRQPAIEDPRNGIGLGLIMIKGFACTHGGTVLVDKKTDGLTRITVTMEIRKTSDAKLSTGGLPTDHYGGYNQGLVEFSDVLPTHLYDGRY